VALNSLTRASMFHTFVERIEEIEKTGEVRENKKVPCPRCGGLGYLERRRRESMESTSLKLESRRDALYS